MLGDLNAKLQQRFSLEWRTAADAEWKVRHQAVQQERRRLAELEAHPVHTPAEAVELACLSEDHHPGVDAVPLYQQALRWAPSHANGHYRLGALLLKRGSASEGMQHLQRAMELDALLVEPALRALERHAASENGSSTWQASIQSLRDRYSRHLGEIDVEDAGALQPHALDASQLRELARALRSYDKVRKAWVVRRQLTGTEVMPHFLVLLEWAGSVASEQAAVPRIASQLQLPGSCTVLTATTDAAQARAVRSSAGEPAYQKP
jgi:tetratricopeptide (TPR) repeat protein